MIPTPLLLQALADLLAADPATLAPAALANHVHLIIAPFNPDSVTVPGDLTFATFTGSTPKNAGVGTQQSFIDPVSTRRVVQILEPAGGWTWECTVDPAVPETVYGFALTDNTDADLYGTAVVDTPVVISAAGEAVTVGNVRFTFNPQPLT